MSATKYKLAIVDDHQIVIDGLRSLLKGYDQYEIVIESNHPEAIPSLLQQQQIDIMLTDVMMPVMDGFELCKQIKSNFESSHIAVILLTAKNTLQSKIEGLEIGADAYIDKPFSPKHLQVQIANLLVNKNKIKEYFSKSPLVHMNSLAYTKADEQFLEELNNAIDLHMNDSNLDVEHLAGHMNMSRPTLYRKIKAVSDLTPNELINLARLKRAAKLFAEGNTRINEIAELVGYTSPLHFTRNFQKQFGMLPTDYLKGRTGE